MISSPPRRKFERVPFSVRVSLSAPPSISNMDCRSVDISFGGVGLISEGPLPLGRPVMLTFHLRTRSGMATEQVSARVINVRFDDDASITGLEFSEILHEMKCPELVKMIERL